MIVALWADVVLQRTFAVSVLRKEIKLGVSCKSEPHGKKGEYVISFLMMVTL
jgi:hypothetical protein